MYVRLAFAVAAHLEPEILIIDEVLAVGDIAFQKKCLGKMQNVADAGRTVIFVSHNLPAVIDLTTRTVLIECGGLRATGPSRDIVSQFLRIAQERAQGTNQASAYRRPVRKDGYVDIDSVKVCGVPNGTALVEFGKDIVIDVDLTVKQPIEEGIININIFNEQLEAITTLASADSEYTFTLAPGQHTIRCNAGALPLVPGDYRLRVGTAQNGGGLAWDALEMLPGFRIEGHNNRAWINWPSRPGMVLFDRCSWCETTNRS
jgi:lipopolysaccharide transport system ATP-binding protein